MYFRLYLPQTFNISCFLYSIQELLLLWDSLLREECQIENSPHRTQSGGQILLQTPITYIWPLCNMLPVLNLKNILFSYNNNNAIDLFTRLYLVSRSYTIFYFVCNSDV